MSNKKIVLVCYPAVYFLHFAEALERDGFEVFWICALNADAQHLLSNGVTASRVLDLTQGSNHTKYSEAEVGLQLSYWEHSDLPKVNNIILMDRLLRLKPYEFARNYLLHVAESVAGFLERSCVELASSWRDTAPQLMTMNVCKRLGIPCVVPTRSRIPQEMYAFSVGHETQNMLQLRAIGEADRDWANKFLDTHEKRHQKPALKRAAEGWGDVLRMLPVHIKTLRYEISRAQADRGNDYTRYTIPRLISLYVRRKINLLSYQLRRPADKKGIGDGPFCLYALHTQPESSIDVQAAYFSNQIDLIRHIARSLPASHALYVKVHPTDVDGQTFNFYHQLAQMPGVRLIDFSADSRLLLERSSIVFALTGTIAYEAALLGKPVVVMAENFFNKLPSVHTCLTPTQLPQLVRTLLDNNINVEHLRPQIIDFLSWLRACSYDGEVSRFHQGHHIRLNSADIKTVCRAYSDLLRYFDANRKVGSQKEYDDE